MTNPLKRLQLTHTLFFEHPHPTIVDINLTEKCNQKCIYCEIGQGIVKKEKSDKPYLNLDDLTWIIDEMDREKIPTLILQGGEPFLFKDLFSVIEYADNAGIQVVITTNGMLIPRLTDKELSLLKKAHCTFSVSIDSCDPATEKIVRGVDNAYDAAIEGITTLIKNEIPVSICTVVTMYNFQNLADLVKIADDLGVASIHFQPLITISNYPEVSCISEKKTLNLRPEDIEGLVREFKKILEFERTHTISTNITNLQKWISDYIQFCSGRNSEKTFFFEYHLYRFFCYELFNRIRINYYGEILPCHFIPGNVSIKNSPARTLVELWNQVCQPVRTSIRNQAYPAQCNGCVCSHDTNLVLSSIKHPVVNRSMLLRIFQKE